MAQPTLTVIVEHRVVSRIAVSGPVTIGRLDDNSVVLNDTSVSGHHARIERGEPGWSVVDLGSSNGSLVAGGPRLGRDQRHPLREVTQILVGSTVLEFDPQDDVPREAGSGSTSISFAGQPADDVRRRGAPAADGGPDSAPSRSRPGEQADPTTGFIVTHGEQLHDGPLLEQELGAGAHPLGATPSGLPPHAHQRRPATRPRVRSQLPPVSPGRSDTRARGVGPPASGSQQTGSRRGGVPPAARPQSPTTTDGAAPRADERPRPRAPTPAAIPRTDPPPLATATGPTAPPSARLLIALDAVVSEVLLDRAVVLVGRNPRCDVVIDHPSISGRHTQLFLEDGRWQVRDLGSTNGTRVGLVRTDGVHALPPCCHLILGAADLLFVCDPADGRDDVADKGFLDWLRSRRQVNRTEARLALAEARASGRSVGEVLVAHGVLSPGALVELSHNAALGTRELARPSATRRLGRWICWLLAAAAAVALIVLL